MTLVRFVCCVQYIPEFPNLATGFWDQNMAGIVYAANAEYNTDLFVSQLTGRRLAPCLLDSLLTPMPLISVGL